MSFRAVFRSLRPHQWTKNLLLFAALAFSKHLFDPDLFAAAAAAFAVFCGLSGTVYLVNDIVDLERDRLHPVKRHRPLPRGDLSVGAARMVALVLGAASLAAAVALRPLFAALAVAYVALNLLYSFLLKDVVLLDVLTLSLSFVIRAVAGAVVIRVHFSEWLLMCTILLALFLSLAKRRHELVSLSDAASHRSSLAEYSPYLLDQMIGVVAASCVMSYALYTTARETVERFATDRLIWTFPFVLYGIFRYLYLVHQKEQGGSPTEVLLTDKPLLLDLALWALAIVAIVYTAPGPPVPVGRP
jgi:4-hydroxybenzoate polyprenyltransferase